MDFLEHVKDLYSNGTTFLPPFVKNLSSNLLLGSAALQALFGNPAVPSEYSSDKPTQSLESFIKWEKPIALDIILCNIGPSCLDDQSVHPGVLIASPSKEDPDYFYTWTRDAALVFQGLVELFTWDESPDLQQEIHDYVVAQSLLQRVSSLSGSLCNGSGLGEPRFEVNLSDFSGDWGRPQRDGPPLRAIALISYSKWLVENGYRNEAEEKIWPLVQNDLSYVAQYWNHTGFDLWEEVDGSSFFTTISQYRALVEGGNLARDLGFSCPHCDTIAPRILCFLQDFSSRKEDYVISNIHHTHDRTGKDANSILASIHSFDLAQGCSRLTFQPCSDKALANHKAVVDAFREIYPINSDMIGSGSGSGTGHAAAVGRYAEDVYYGGQPWYLTTLAAAEQLYDAVMVWKDQGSLDVTDLSLPFMRDVVPSIRPGSYNATDATFGEVLEAVTAYADGFMAVVARYAHKNGSLSEQFHRKTGEPLSARDLTWSYAAFLSAAARREGKAPRSWLPKEQQQQQLAGGGGDCGAKAVVGFYSNAPLTSFPLPTSTTVDPRPVPTYCGGARYVVVTFEEQVETSWGQTVKMVGSAEQLGNWDPELGVELSADEYTDGRPLWSVDMVMEVAEELRYKFVKLTDGQVEWEGGEDRTFTAPECTSTAVVQGKWK